MADRWAVASGNWSSTSTWNGGTLPGVNDDVYADGFNVTINQNVTVLSLRTTARSGGTAGGQFTTSGARTVNADTYAGTSYALFMDGGVSVQNGNSYGSSTGGTGFWATVCLNGSYQVGNSYGGSTGRGTYCQSGGYQIGDSYGGGNSWMTVGTTLQTGGAQFGNCYGSTTSNGAYGTWMTGLGTTLHGNAYGMSVGGFQSAGLYARDMSKHIGNSYGGDLENSIGAGYVEGAQHVGDSFGGSAVGAVGSYVTYAYHIGNSYGGAVAAGTHVASGGAHLGESRGGFGSQAYGTLCENGGRHIGNAFSSNLTSNVSGTFCRAGGMHIGNAFGGDMQFRVGVQLESGGVGVGTGFGGAANLAYGYLAGYGGIFIGRGFGGGAASAYGACVWNYSFGAVGESRANTHATGTTKGVLIDVARVLRYNGVLLGELDVAAEVDVDTTHPYSLATAFWRLPVLYGNTARFPVIGSGGVVRRGAF